MWGRLEAAPRRQFDQPAPLKPSVGLPAFASDLPAPVERLHYFHPFRLGLGILVIVGADLGLNLWVGGGLVGVEARTALLVVLLLSVLVRTFLPRTLSADATEIRWKKAFQPVRWVPRRDVVAILYVTTAGPGASRYYFVGRDGTAVLWIDRFTPARMASFASYLAIPMRPVTHAPAASPASQAADKANALTGARRAGLLVMAVLTVICLLGTAGAVAAVLHYRQELADYGRAPLCAAPAANPRACRFHATAVVTDWTTGSRGRIYLRFSSDVPTRHSRTAWVRLLGDVPPDPPFGIGNTVQLEVFDGYLTEINGARTDEYGLLQSNASWLLVAGAGFFVFFCGVGLIALWRVPDSWYAPRGSALAPSQNPAPGPTLLEAEGDQPGSNEAPGGVEGLAHRLWMAWVG